MTTIRNSIRTGSIILLFRLLTVFANQEAPCSYSDTVELDETKRFENGSYMYDDFLVEPEIIGEYDYKIFIGDNKTTVPVHKRACICELRPCVSLCCPPGQEFNQLNCVKSYTPYNENVNVTESGDDGPKMYPISAYFAIQFHRPCEKMYFLQPDIHETDGYTFYDNGTLFRHSDSKTLIKDEYCFSQLFDENTAEKTLLPVICYKILEEENLFRGYALLISVPFMILTIIVYLSIPELRTVQYLSFCCYLAGLVVGYSIIAFLVFEPSKDIPDFDCAVLGYTAYFAFMSAFFWLSVISYDCYQYVSGCRSYTNMKRFGVYSLYAYGMAFIFLIFAYYSQTSSLISKHLKAGIGGADFCFLNGKYGWSAMIYFYGPILIIITFNTVMFVKIALEFKRGLTHHDFKPTGTTPTKNIEFKHTFLTFLRLFILMGVIWFTEILSYLTPEGSVFSNVLAVTDFLNAIQGLIIFILFVLGKKVRLMILKRFRKNDTMEFSHGEEMTECI